MCIQFSLCLPQLFPQPVPLHPLRPRPAISSLPILQITPTPSHSLSLFISVFVIVLLVGTDLVYPAHSLYEGRDDLRHLPKFVRGEQMSKLMISRILELGQTLALAFGASGLAGRLAAA